MARASDGGTLFRQLTLLFGLLLPVTAILSPASASAARVSDDCLRTKVWDSYGDGWQVRASTSAEVGFGRTTFYRVSMLKGRNYRVLTCADANVQDLDVLLYDHEGNVVLRDDTVDREPSVSFQPERTGVHYVVLYVRGAADPALANDVSLALIHR